MSKIVSWDVLEKVDVTRFTVVNCPKLSVITGQEINVKVRALEAVELLKALNFPLDEINQMVSEGAGEGEFVAAVQEHVKTFSVTDLLETMESVIKTGLVEPDPAGGSMDKLSPDFEAIFSEIVRLTIPKEATAEAAGFRQDG